MKLLLASMRNHQDDQEKWTAEMREVVAALLGVTPILVETLKEQINALNTLLTCLEPSGLFC